MPRPTLWIRVRTCCDFRGTLDVVVEVCRDDLGISRISDSARDARLKGQDGKEPKGECPHHDWHDRDDDDQFDQCESLFVTLNLNVGVI